MAIDDILKERPTKHGEFEENSRATWAIMHALEAERNWPTMKAGQKHALYMVAHKMARILAGDPDLPEHWDDIAGYALCIANRIREPIRPYESDDVYSALARGWNISRDDARVRVQHMVKHDQPHQLKRPTNGSAQTAGGSGSAEASKVPSGVPSGRSYAANDRPGTPEDGGEHGTANLDSLAEDLRREIEKDQQ